MFELAKLSKTFGDLKALSDIELSIPEGQTTVLIGPSGCGKSTLIRLMVGLVWPDAGTVTLDGQALMPENVLALRQKVGYVIQDGGLFPHLTAQANVALMAKHLGWTQNQIDERVEALATLTHFPADGLERFPGELSGGQQQRVGLMRALMLDPAVLLLDEPLGALDPMIRADLQSELRSIFQTLGKTVVMVTHDIGEAGFLGDQIVLMQEGEIVQIGRLKDLVQNPEREFVTQFINAQRSPLEGLE
ncbi:MAG: ABC transporter ATP-binding protein [Candidatus Latescibacteria bacterium]|jgi:osmoprotectant transport system ATP-binding protein|nr:ABC transporter ATP-binding protein [Candidatus Latescibacterota bacterium]MBT4139439.1 ABC transporter ATP-binding protein [Candidatus Latescibacterota bacterium]MBT5829034.1 ABC transporter ATP-binding protein [Candidatus Latescibacterota bacterium]